LPLPTHSCLSANQGADSRH